VSQLLTKSPLLIKRSKKSPLLPFLSYINFYRGLLMYFYKINFIVNLPYTSPSSKASPSFSFLRQNPVSQESSTVAIPRSRKLIFELFRPSIHTTNKTISLWLGMGNKQLHCIILIINCNQRIIQSIYRNLKKWNRFHRAERVKVKFRTTFEGKDMLAHFYIFLTIWVTFTRRTLSLINPHLLQIYICSSRQQLQKTHTQKRM